MFDCVDAVFFKAKVQNEEQVEEKRKAMDLQEIPETRKAEDLRKIAEAHTEKVQGLDVTPYFELAYN